MRSDNFIVSMRKYVNGNRAKALMVLVVLAAPLFLFFGLVVMPIIIFLLKASLGKS